MSTKNETVKAEFAKYPVAMSCSAGSSTYTVADIDFSAIVPEGATFIRVDAVELRGVRTSGSGALDTFSGYTYPFKLGSVSEKFSNNFDIVTVRSWINTYGFKPMPVHLGFKAESGAGYGTYYGNIYCSVTLTYAVEVDDAIQYYTTNAFVPCEISRYNSGGEWEPVAVQYYQSGWHEV